MNHLTAYPWLDPLWQQLMATHNAGRLHHALLVSGAAGVGKAWLANQYAKALLCNEANAPCGRCKSCLLMDAGSHPDCIELSAEGTSIGIDEIRRAGQFIYQTSQMGEARVLLIDGAQTLTEAAANALLKSLEEPGRKVYFLLTCLSAEQLLPTIRSRCALLPVKVDDHRQAYQWLMSSMSQPVSLSFEGFERLMALSQNAPLTIAQWIEEGLLTAIDEAFEQSALWLNGQLDHLTFKQLLVEQPFAMDVFVRQLLDTVSCRLAGQNAGDTSQTFVVIGQLIEQLNDFGRDSRAVMGQNKDLGLLRLLTRIANTLN